MKLLYITPRFPYPPLKGDQVVPFNRLRLLSKRHRITIITLYQHESELKYLEKLKPFCEEIKTVKLNKSRSFANMMGGIFSKLPFQVLYFLSADFHKVLNELLTNNDFDIVHTYMLRMAEYTKHINKPKVLDLIDSMQLNLERRISLEKYPANLIFKKELERIKTYERYIIEKYDISIVVSEKDKICIGSDKVIDISLGVDTNKFKPLGDLINNKIIVFSGNMEYFPNENAIIWFLENCFNFVKTKVPDTKLMIVGNNPSSKLRRFHDGTSVVVKGFVDSMVDELNNAQIAIAPMQSGSGMQFKILEAMSCGLPVITTTLGLGAIKATDNENIVVADTSTEFVNACIELLDNYKLAQKIGFKAMELVRKKYSWESNIEQVEYIYKSIICQKDIN